MNYSDMIDEAAYILMNLLAPVYELFQNLHEILLSAGRGGAVV